MKIISTYSEEIKEHNSVFSDTVKIYRAAVDFFIGVADAEWETVSKLNSLKEKLTMLEFLTNRTEKHTIVKYPFYEADKRFYKLPSYLRRAAINEAIGKVSSYRSNLANWENSESDTKGKKPGFPKAGYVYPVLYRGNMFKETEDEYAAEIKVFIRHTWDWITVHFRKSDVDYIKHHCKEFKYGIGAMSYRKICAPTLQKRYKKWYLDFPIEEKVKLTDVPVGEQTIVAVDLGINSACTCAVMKSNGTVLGRKFLSLPRENDSLNHAINKIKKAQQHGARKIPGLWAKAKGINDRISVRTAQFIVDVAVMYNADVIVMEHLEKKGKKRGSKKQRLHMWKSQYVQAMVAHKAHRNGIRISRICAYKTSRLAYDGSGEVLRGKESEKTNNNYSLCEFTTGKVYNCDLNASYNIGARYFVRELTKSLSATARLQLEAKVPAACKRNTCTLSTLISLNAVLTA